MIADIKKAFDLTDEGDVNAFLGVQIGHNKYGSITMSQPGLIEQVVEYVKLINTSKKHDTPALTKPLLKHEHDKPFNEDWSYRSLVGKLSYLAKNNRPDIEFVVHQCERHQINPRNTHANAIKRICRYLLITKDKEITFTSSDNLSDIKAYVDADFCGSYEGINSNDPNGCRSRTGYILFYAGCPVLWRSKLQTEIALSTTEVEYIDLSQSTRELLPLRELLIELSEALKLPATQLNAKCTVFEDNTGAEELARTAKYRPRTKHIALKYHHFRQFVRNGIITINCINTNDQLANTFTKTLPKAQLRSLGKASKGGQASFSTKNRFH